jgi:hydrogenase/urease accessory protein HupE
MKITSLLRVSGLSSVALLLASTAQAHPGHDGDHGGGLTWDFTGQLVHILTSPYHMLPATVTGVLAFYCWKRIRAKRDASRSDD